MSDLEGRKAPAFSLEGSDGKKHSLSDYRGKTVEGPIRSTVVIGPDGMVLRHWNPVQNAEEHPKEVLQYLRR